MNNQDNDSTFALINRVGFYSSIFLTAITVLAFGLAMVAVPISGANAPEGGIRYPYMGTAAQYPNDFLWMYAAIVLVLTYLVVMISIHSREDNERQILSRIGLSIATMAAVILIIDYYIQLAVVPVSLQNNEMEGLALIIQYNPHGIFIALEEIGYIMMTLSFVFMALSFRHKTRLEGVIRWVFMIPFPVSMVSLILYSIKYGLDRQDRFEVVILSLAWLVLVVNGIFLSMYFSRLGRKPASKLLL